MQLSLDGMEPAAVPPQPKKHRLLFAILPDEHAQERTLEAAHGLREQCGLRGRVFQRNRLHVTLHTFYEGKRVPPAVVELASRAGRSVTASSFVVSLDTAFSFDNKPSNQPLVISGQRGTAELTHFQRFVLAGSMRRHSLGTVVQQHFVPHATVLYDDQVVPPTAVEPISWIVRDFVLIHSHVGLSKYDILGRWRLGN